MSGDLSLEELQETQDSINEVYFRDISNNVLVSNKGKALSEYDLSQSLQSSADVTEQEERTAVKLFKRGLTTIVEEDSITEDKFEIMDDLRVSEELILPFTLLSLSSSKNVKLLDYSKTLSNVNLMPTVKREPAEEEN
uniref:Uncharacterized protein n=1 Tax=Euplotes harpa TaxID=151035 RepID=A0A7S3JIC4_9SPIT|mmetsp:Transcript_37673/g.43272  ORF Transcript_37673/g.43272 Transcript_37673/m.43272 type:complete len:138 (+) Transcript_37673:53-466(+)|eukprot:CAMPEP_0168339668 /NCGR_PEP_ID=MMETSP0213-20121227/13599_1 /TAXON_ID=151035 /ORGANISM="Euplotes harpa, Strain FSP1.4" /LENGTH=137 /DNA_ID=CAMNT_0008345745 /DNA_START=52 /DNA_END=465 /DNA_ORIENTATION=-